MIALWIYIIDPHVLSSQQIQEVGIIVALHLRGERTGQKNKSKNNTRGKSKSLII